MEAQPIKSRELKISVVMVTYLCGPPVFDQCQDCCHSDAIKQQPIAGGNDGCLIAICRLGSDPLRPGMCAWFEDLSTGRELCRVDRVR